MTFLKLLGLSRPVSRSVSVNIRTVRRRLASTGVMTSISKHDWSSWRIASAQSSRSSLHQSSPGPTRPPSPSEPLSVPRSSTPPLSFWSTQTSKATRHHPDGVSQELSNHLELHACRRNHASQRRGIYRSAKTRHSTSRSVPVFHQPLPSARLQTASSQATSLPKPRPLSRSIRRGCRRNCRTRTFCTGSLYAGQQLAANVSCNQRLRPRRSAVEETFYLSTNQNTQAFKAMTGH